MKICYLADGQSIHTKRWCDHFSKSGHEVHLITFRNTRIENTTVHFLNSGNISVKGGNWRVLLQVSAVKKILNKIKPDILHAHYATSYGLVGALTGFHPFVVAALGTDVLISAQKSFLYRSIVKYVFKKADWINSMADHMSAQVIKLGVNPNKVSAIIFGIDPTIFNHNNRNVPEGKFILTSTRNFEPVYNIPLLLNALDLVKNKIPDLSVNLIGEGSLRSELKKSIEDLGLKEKVKFHGKIPQSEISGILNQTHVFVTTSLSDGNNVSLNEAMACGAISLATDIPANKQWIQEDVNGFLIPTNQPEILADKILYVYKNYRELEKRTIVFNDKIIAEKALWTVNMAMVENKYKKLSETK